MSEFIKSTYDHIPGSRPLKCKYEATHIRRLQVDMLATEAGHKVRKRRAGDNRMRDELRLLYFAYAFYRGVPFSKLVGRSHSTFKYELGKVKAIVDKYRPTVWNYPGQLPYAQRKERNAAELERLDKNWELWYAEACAHEDKKEAARRARHEQAAAAAE